MSPTAQRAYISLIAFMPILTADVPERNRGTLSSAYQADPRTYGGGRGSTPHENPPRRPPGSLGTCQLRGDRTPWANRSNCSETHSQVGATSSRQGQLRCDGTSTSAMTPDHCA